MQDVEHVGDGRAGRRGDDADGFGEARDGAFAVGVEEPLGGELALERLEFGREQPRSGGLHEVDVELVLPARLVDGHHAAHVNEHPLGQRDRGVAQAGPEEEDARELAAVVLERKILVPRGLFAVVAHLALHPDFAQRSLDQLAHGAGQFRDRKDVRGVRFFEIGHGVECRISGRDMPITHWSHYSYNSHASGEWGLWE